MSSGAKALRPPSRVLGSPNSCGGGTISPETRGVQSPETGGLAGGGKGMSAGNPPGRR